MATSSAQAGFLQSVFSAVPHDDVLENAITLTIAGVTGLDQNYAVRPRFQEDPPANPDRSVDWVSFGIQRILATSFASQLQLSATSVAVIRYQELELLLSWYGPHASSFAEMFRDGLQIDQNRDLLRASDIGLVGVSESTRAPELFKAKYLNRYDQTMTVRRRTQRSYAISVLTSAGIILNTDPVGETPISIPIQEN